MQLTLLERVSGCLLFNSSRLITCTHCSSATPHHPPHHPPLHLPPLRGVPRSDSGQASQLGPIRPELPLPARSRSYTCRIRKASPMRKGRIGRPPRQDPSPSSRPAPSTSPTPFHPTSLNHPSPVHPASPRHTTRHPTASACPLRWSARPAAATTPAPAPSSDRPGASAPPPPHHSVG
jgi:hypothetical protein